MACYIEWTEPAAIDLAGIFDYIARDSAIYAEQFTQQLIRATHRLIDFPQSGRPVPEAKESPDNIRELIFRNYRVIYDHPINSELVRVLAVVHGAQDLAGNVDKPWE